MNIVIPCANHKTLEPPTIYGGQSIHFQAAEDLDNNRYTPWSRVPGGNYTFVELLQRQNQKGLDADEAGIDEKSLCAAGELYSNPVYEEVREFCNQNGHNLYILSAGWGLVSATTRLPAYDVTFSNQAQREKRITTAQRLRQPYLNELASLKTETHVFLPSKYLQFFVGMGMGMRNLRVHWGRHLPEATYDMLGVPAENVVRVDVNNANTNWHYNAINAFIE
jgi:hypothetical protein